jgi:hypothetical protein
MLNIYILFPKSEEKRSVAKRSARGETILKRISINLTLKLWPGSICPVAGFDEENNRSLWVQKNEVDC